MNRYLLPLVVLFVLVLGGAWALTRQRPATGDQRPDTAAPGGRTVTPNQGRPAPDITRPALDGTTVSLAEFKDQKHVLVNSWAVWCPFCLQELADFATLAEEYQADLVILAVDRAEPEATQRDFLADVQGRNLLQSKLRFLVDPQDEVYKLLTGYGMPVTMFVKKDGTVALVKNGPMTIDEMRTQVREHFGLP